MIGAVIAFFVEHALHRKSRDPIKINPRDRLNK